MLKLIQIKCLKAITILFAVAHLNAAANAETIALVGGRLIDGNGGTPTVDSVVLVENGLITAVGVEGDIKIPADAQIIDTNGKTVMPGLIELHTHMELIGHSDYDVWFSEYPLRMEKEIFPMSTRALLNAGVTSARDLGADVDSIFRLKEKLNTEQMVGPRLFVAGPFLRKNPAYYPSEDVRDTWQVADAEDGRAKVRQLVQRGADVIKTQDDDFTVEEFRAIFDEAHKNGLPVASHLYTTEGIRKALLAGLREKDTIEHVGEDPSMAYPDDVVKMIIDQKVYMSPTAMARDGFRQMVENPEMIDDPIWRDSLSAELYQEVRRSYRGIDMKKHPLYDRAINRQPARQAKLRQLYKAGAQFVVGSDSGTRANPQHTATWREMVLLVDEVGIPNMEVIEATTRLAAGVLGKEDELGTIEAGKIADIIVVNGDPLAHMSDMRLVERVIQRGKIVR